MKDYVVQIVAFVVIGVLLYFLWSVGVWLGDYIKQVKPENAVTLIVGSITVVVTVSINLWVKYLERKNTIELSLRQAREQVYNRYVTIFQTALNNNTQFNAEEIVILNKDIVLQASDKTLKLLGKFRMDAINGKDYGKERLRQYANIILSMRSDLGYKNKDLKEIDVLRHFINDADTYFK